MAAKFGMEYPVTPENTDLNFLKLFYPFHYTVGMAVEKALSGPRLDRHQTVILWIIRSKGTDGNTLERKVIEQLIAEWYELGSPAISKTLRKMAAPPLSLLTLRESATSGREKVVSLTPAGSAEIARMIERATSFINTISGQLTNAQILNGLNFMARVGEILESREAL